MKKKIYFVRHGQSKANADGLAAGGKLDTPLTDIGREQAKATGQKLKDKKVQLIVSSPISRALETAEIIAKEIGYDSKKIIINPGFTERDFGIYDSKSHEEFVAAMVSDNPIHQSVETSEAIYQRVDSGLNWLKKQNADRIVLVSHGGVNRVLRIMHQSLPLSHMYKIDMWPNGAIYEFEL